MGDMIMLPTGDVLIINGAGNRTAGWDNADSPVLHPVLYRTYEPDPSRQFVVMKPSDIPRMYHSSAVLVSDGRIIVAGSNPNPEYTFIGARFPTELQRSRGCPGISSIGTTAVSSTAPSRDRGKGGRFLQWEIKAARKKEPDAEKTRRLMPNWAANRWVQPRKESEMMEDGGEGWEENHCRRGRWRRRREDRMERKDPGGRSWLFSAPSGREGWGGKGRTRAAREKGGWMERKGRRMGRLPGVTRTVTVMEDGDI